MAKNDRNVHVIHTDDLSQHFDLVHFDKEGQMGLGIAAIPIGEALLASGLDGGLNIRGFHGMDVNGSHLVQQLTKDGEGE